MDSRTARVKSWHCWPYLLRTKQKRKCLCIFFETRSRDEWENFIWKRSVASRRNVNEYEHIKKKKEFLENWKSVCCIKLRRLIRVLICETIHRSIIGDTFFLFDIRCSRSANLERIYNWQGKSADFNGTLLNRQRPLDWIEFASFNGSQIHLRPWKLRAHSSHD